MLFHISGCSTEQVVAVVWEEEAEERSEGGVRIGKLAKQQSFGLSRNQSSAKWSVTVSVKVKSYPCYIVIRHFPPNPCKPCSSDSSANNSFFSDFHLSSR